MSSENAESGRRFRKRKKDVGDGSVSGFATRLAELRGARNLSQKDLAEMARVHYTHISRYERGLSRPAADVLKRLADALAVSGDYLLEGSTQDVAQEKLQDRELLRMFKAAETLSEADKATVKIFLDAFLTKRELQVIASR